MIERADRFVALEALHGDAFLRVCDIAAVYDVETADDGPCAAVVMRDTNRVFVSVTAGEVIEAIDASVMEAP